MGAAGLGKQEFTGRVSTAGPTRPVDGMADDMLFYKARVESGVHRR